MISLDYIHCTNRRTALAATPKLNHFRSFSINGAAAAVDYIHIAINGNLVSKGVKALNDFNRQCHRFLLNFFHVSFS